MRGNFILGRRAFLTATGGFLALALAGRSITSHNNARLALPPAERDLDDPALKMYRPMPKETSGCVRLLHQDIIHLYERVTWGSPLVVLAQG